MEGKKLKKMTRKNVTLKLDFGKLHQILSCKLPANPRKKFMYKVKQIDKDNRHFIPSLNH